MSDGVYGVSVYLSNALKALREVADVSKRCYCFGLNYIDGNGRYLVKSNF